MIGSQSEVSNQVNEREPLYVRYHKEPLEVDPSDCEYIQMI
jgi:hypothetical protein